MKTPTETFAPINSTPLLAAPQYTPSKNAVMNVPQPNSGSSSAKNNENELGLAIAALLVNVLLLPGLGSIIGGKTKEGVWQLVLFIIGIPLIFILIGFPIMIGAWIWGVVTGVKLVTNATAKN